MLPDNLVSTVAFDPLCARIPTDNIALRISMRIA
jgi:hypothetical protein